MKMKMSMNACMYHVKRQKLGVQGLPPPPPPQKDHQAPRVLVSGCLSVWFVSVEGGKGQRAGGGGGKFLTVLSLSPCREYVRPTNGKGFQS